MKKIVILGSTGSIGTNTLDIVTKFPAQFQVVGLTAGTNDDKLEEQLRQFKPAVVALSDELAAARLRATAVSLSTDRFYLPLSLQALAASSGTSMRRVLTTRVTRSMAKT